MSRVLLLQIPFAAEVCWPMGLSQLASVLEAAGHEVVGVDLQLADRAEARRAARSADWIVTTTLPHTLADVRDALRACRGPRARAVVVGLGVSVDPTGILRHTGADLGVLGDPERAVVALADGLDPDAVPGVLTPGRTATPQRVPLADLPLPDRHHFPCEPYGHAMRAVATPYALAFTSRGCGRHCAFCPVPARHPSGFDGRPAEQVEEEWSRLAVDHGIASVHVEDDAFCADPERARAIGEHLARRAGAPGARLPVWELVNGVRPADVDADLLRALAAGGCRRLVFGFEHLGPVVAPDTDTDPARARALVAVARSLGMRVGGYFVVGLPGKGRRETLRSLVEAWRLDLDDANWIPFHPVPGAPLAGERLHPWTETAVLGATAAFFLRPRAAGNLSRDLTHDPSTAPQLAAKAVELLRHGGPVPTRDQP